MQLYKKKNQILPKKYKECKKGPKNPAQLNTFTSKYGDKSIHAVIQHMLPGYKDKFGVPSVWIIQTLRTRQKSKDVQLCTLVDFVKQHNK